MNATQNELMNSAPVYAGLIPCGNANPSGWRARTFLGGDGRDKVVEPIYEYCEWEDIGVPQEAALSFECALGNYVTSNILYVWERTEFDWRGIFADRQNALYHLYNGGNCPRSPIESMLAGWLVWLDGEYFGFPDCSPEFLDVLLEEWKSGDKSRGDVPRLFLISQDKHGSYKSDFTLTAYYQGKVSRTVVECDGHDFHEKTKAQAAHDKKRDRSMVTSGCRVLRFTGSEIFKDARSCAAQIREVVLQSYRDVGL